MEMEPGRIELTFHVTGLVIPYATDPAWPLADLTQYLDGRATLRLWADGVSPQAIEAACQDLTEQAAGFELALRYQGNRGLTCRLQSAAFRATTEIRAHNCAALASRLTALSAELAGGVSLADSVRLSDALSLAVVRQAPEAMPCMPLHCARWVETLLIARAAEADPAQALRIEFLLLEEFEADVDPALYEQLKAARDFVSHPVVNRTRPIDFIRAEFPQALLPGGQEARYDTSQVEHRNFISRWEVKARDEVTRLIEQRCPVS